MYQETEAQRRKSPKKKAMPVEVKIVPPDITYTVSMSKPWTHLLEVEMRLNWAQMPEKAELKMPVWTPGSYLIREYARHVEDFSAKDATGNNLTWQKTSKNTWQIDTKGAKEIVARYNVYANELTVRTNELNDQHAFFNNSALLMFPKDQLKTASTVAIFHSETGRLPPDSRKSKDKRMFFAPKISTFCMIRRLKSETLSKRRLIFVTFRIA